MSLEQTSSGESFPQTSSFFADLSVAPPNEIFNTKAAYLADKDPRKVNLGIGAYRTDEGKPYVLPIVKKAEIALAADNARNKEYLGISGDAAFVKVAQKLIFGNDSDALKEGRIAGSQALSGTGALRILFEFIAAHMPGVTCYLSRPTWENHYSVLVKCGIKPAFYSYWDPKTRGLDFEGMTADIENAPNGSIILLHACAHNPTGVDPTMEQWTQLMHLIKRKNHIAFFDSAYQGFASGDLDRDAAAVRMFVKNGCEVFVAQSFAKNLGLYGERIGCASIVCRTPAIAKAVSSQLNLVIRPMYSNPPMHGAKIVTYVLSNPQNFREWQNELTMMSGRIEAMRKALVAELERLGTPSSSGDWKHITSQIGMFAYTGLTAAQVSKMVSKHHIYLLKSGRISLAGLNSKNVSYVAQAIDDVVRNA